MSLNGRGGKDASSFSRRVVISRCAGERLGLGLMLPTSPSVSQLSFLHPLLSPLENTLAYQWCVLMCFDSYFCYHLKPFLFLIQSQTPFGSYYFVGWTQYWSGDWIFPLLTLEGIDCRSVGRGTELGKTDSKPPQPGLQLEKLPSVLFLQVRE